MTAPGREPLSGVERAIHRRIRLCGPQDRCGLLQLPWCQEKVYDALQSLQSRGVIHVTRREKPGPRGRLRLYWGLVGVHPYAPSSREQVVAFITEHGPSWPQDIAQALDLHRTSINSHCKALIADGTLERVNGSRRRVLYRLAQAPAMAAK